MEYKVLSQIQTEEILKCMNKAFSDYLQPIHFTKDSLQRFFQASDVNQSLSYCAYLDNIMVGFILNSSNIYNDELVVFDAGTGVIPEYRGQGVFTSLYAHTQQELCKHNIKKYYLEVIQENTRAKSLYERNGFSIVREYSVMRLTELIHKGNHQNVQIKTLKEFNFSNVNTLTLIKPSFEHSYHVIMKNPEFYKVAYLENDSKIEAFCVYSAHNGALIELGYDNLSDLKDILIYLASNYKTISAKNIDASYTSLIEMMQSIGFKEYVSQYEMVKDISALDIKE